MSGPDESLAPSDGPGGHEQGLRRYFREFAENQVLQKPEQEFDKLWLGSDRQPRNGVNSLSGKTELS